MCLYYVRWLVVCSAWDINEEHYQGQLPLKLNAENCCWLPTSRNLSHSVIGGSLLLCLHPCKLFPHTCSIIIVCTEFMLFWIPVTMSLCQHTQKESVKFLYTGISSAKISKCPLSQNPFICPRCLNCQVFCMKRFCLNWYFLHLKL